MVCPFTYGSKDIFTLSSTSICMVRPVTRNQLIADLQRVADEIGEPPSGREYNEHGEYSKSALYREFDSIHDAREAAGLDSSDKRGDAQEINRQELLNAIHRLHDEFSRPPKRDEMLEHGDYSEGPFRREFGSWGEAVTEAGYEPYRPNTELAEYTTVSCTRGGCETTDEVLESNTTEQENWFCSRKCKHEWQAEHIVGEAHHQYNQVTVECDYCGESRDRKPAVVESQEMFFCGRDCYAGWCSEERTGEAHPRWKGGDVAVECVICGDKYEVRPVRATESRFCSPECLGVAHKNERSGSDNPNWVEGVVGYYGSNWNEQRKKRLGKDDHACIICGMTQQEHLAEFEQELIVHHVTPIRQFITDDELHEERANRVSNLRTICLTHHQTWEGIPVAPE
jgi:5-methylcytosine-specific restriction endonuclease McrA